MFWSEEGYESHSKAKFSVRKPPQKVIRGDGSLKRWGHGVEKRNNCRRASQVPGWFRISPLSTGGTSMFPQTFLGFTHM